MIKITLQRKPPGIGQQHLDEAVPFRAAPLKFKKKEDNCADAVCKAISASQGYATDPHSIALWLGTPTGFELVADADIDIIISNDAQDHPRDDLLDDYSGYQHDDEGILTHLTIWYTLIQQAAPVQQAQQHSPAGQLQQSSKLKVPKAGVLALRLKHANQSRAKHAAAAVDTQPELSDDDAQKVDASRITKQYVHKYAKELHPQQSNGQFSLFSEGKASHPELVVSTCSMPRCHAECHEMRAVRPLSMQHRVQDRAIKMIVKDVNSKLSSDQHIDEREATGLYKGYVSNAHGRMNLFYETGQGVKQVFVDQRMAEAKQWRTKYVEGAAGEGGMI